MNHHYRPNRRTVIGAIAASSLTTPGYLRLQTSEKSNDTIVDGVENKELYDEIRKVRLEELEGDGPDEDSALMDDFADEYGLNYTRSISRPKDDRPTGEATETTNYSGDHSSIDVAGFAHGYSADTILLSTHMHLDQYGGGSPAYYVEDVISATFDSNDWSVVGNPDWWSDAHDVDMTPVGSDGFSAEVEIYESGNVIAPEANVDLNVPLENQPGSSLSLVYGHYDHTTAWSSTDISSIGVAWGAVTINFSGTANEKWSAADYVNPSTIL